MKWIYNDGGREAAGYKGEAGDCVTRAVAIALGEDYEQARIDLMEATAEWRESSRSRAASRRKSNSVRNGTPKDVSREYLATKGWEWFPTMTIGSGCKVHLRAEELPIGTIIAKVSKHVCAVVDGVIHDTHDPSREGTRCVYGYWKKGQGCG